MSEDKKDLEELCTLYNISPKDVSTYEEKRTRLSKKPAKNNDKSNTFPSSDLLELYEGLSQVNKKLDTVLENQCTILKKMK